MRASPALISINTWETMLTRGRLRCALVALIIPGVALSPGCGLKTESQWENAPGAQEFFGNSAAREALRERDVSSLDTDCEALLPAARQAAVEPGSPGLRVLIQACSQEGLGFGDELRCAGGVLQVRCL